MRTAVITVNSILCAVAFISIYLTNLKAGKKPFDIVKQVVLPGAVVGFFVSLCVVIPIRIADVAAITLFGILAGEMIYIFYLTAKSTWKEEKATVYYDDGTPPKFFITGDKHRNFDYVKAFCRDMSTRKKDVLIILGDAGLNYYGDERDDQLKQEAALLNITLFCIHGNKENRPQNVGTYGIRSFCGGRVYYEPQYPSILFAVDGEIYHFEGRKYMVVGGAHSVDKMRCLEEGKPFWEDEMPDDVIRAKVESGLAKENHTVYGMMTHTCPIAYLPTEMFMSTRQNAAVQRKPKQFKPQKPFEPDIDRSTEEWLGRLEQENHYEVWFCGHYHVDKQIDKVHMMYHEIQPLHMRLSEEAS